MEAAVEQLESGLFRLCWQTDGGRDTVAIYHGTAPDAINGTVPVAVSDKGSIDIDWLDPGVRHYFEIVSGANRVAVAERRLKLDGAVNFRDIGGYAVKDGRRVRWGRVFRSDGLAGLSEKDLKFLENIGIGRVIDFRTDAEVGNAPDRIPGGGGTSYLRLPVTHGKYDFAEAVRRFNEGDTEWLTPDFMLEGYIANLESFPEVWERVLLELLDAGRSALVFHCTGGKDRAGTCAALLLLALGVPAETVVDDHQLSNIYITRLLPDLYRLMRDNGIDPDRVFPYLSAPRDCIAAAVEHIFQKYGSARNYFLTRTSVTEKDMERLEKMLLA